MVGCPPRACRLFRLGCPPVHEHSNVQATDNMTEGLVSLVNLSRLAWRTLKRDTSVHGTKGRLERARSTALQGQDRHVVLP